MIPYGVTGSSFLFCTKYLMEGDKDDPKPHRAEWIETRNLGGEKDPYTAAKMMWATADLSKRCTQPVFHFSLSFPPEEQPDRAFMAKAVDEVLSGYTVRDQRTPKGEPDKMKYLDEYQALIIGHNDTEHQHVHVMLNRVNFETGRAANIGLYKNKLRELCTNFERKHGLRIVTHEGDGNERQLTRNEKMMHRRQGEQAPLRHLSKSGAITLKQEIAPRMTEAKNWQELTTLMDEYSLTFQKKGQGLILTDGDFYIKSSELGKTASFKALEKRMGQSFADYSASLEHEPQDINKMLLEAAQNVEKQRIKGERGGFER